MLTYFSGLRSPWVIIILIWCNIFTLTGQNNFIESVSTGYQPTSVESQVLLKIVQDTSIQNYWLVKTKKAYKFIEGSFLTIDFPDYSFPVNFEANSVETVDTSNYFWPGFGIGGATSLLYGTINGTVGHFYVPGNQAAYGLSALSDSLSVLYRYKNSFYTKEELCESGDDEEELPDSNYVDLTDPLDTVTERTNTPCNVIRILFLYTAGAEETSAEPMSVLQDAVINQLNSSCKNSGLTELEVKFESASSLPILLEGFSEYKRALKTSRKLKNCSEAQKLRNDNYADIVMLFCKAQAFEEAKFDASGHAYNDPPSAKAYGCAQVDKVIGYLKATHGVGHVIGADHQVCKNCCNIRCQERC
jgi:hypothetical protein